MINNNEKNDGNASDVAPLTPKQMEEWNNFQSWMKEKGYAGDPRMNNMSFSKNIVNMYRKENPNTSISYDIVGNVQKSIREYRQSAIENVKSGKGKFSGDPGKDFENFMPWVIKTRDDSFLGEFTSQFKFPSEYISNKYAKEASEQEILERQGFAQEKQPINAMAPETRQRVANQSSYGQYRRLGPNR